MRRQTKIVSFDDARRARPSRSLESAQDRSSANNSRSGARGGSRGAHGSGTLFADEDFYNSLNFADDLGAASRGGGELRGGSRSGARGSSRNGVRGSDNNPRNASRNVERVTEIYEEETFDEDFDPEAVENAKKGKFSKLKEKREKAKRSKAKEKAGKKFADQYGGDAAPSDVSAGPRAAVYKGEMGSQHKRATRLQGEGSSHGASGGSGASMSAASKTEGLSFRRIVGSPAFIVLGAILICVLFCGMFLYGPAKQYYQEMRERDRLELEYAAIQERNESLEASVEYLSTDEGVEDKAREEFGWVKEDEHAVSVSGIDVETNSDFTANIVSSDIKPPDTWYSSFLDPFFGVNYDEKPASEEKKADEEPVENPEGSDEAAKESE